MSHRLWNHRGTMHLDISGGTGRTRGELLFGAALGAVVLVSVGLILFLMLKKPNVPFTTLHMMCRDCGHEFDISERNIPFDRLGPVDGPKADCPKCRGQLTCVEATQCPSCGKYFLQSPEDEGLFCPHCQTDIVKYVRAQPP